MVRLLFFVALLTTFFTVSVASAEAPSQSESEKLKPIIEKIWSDWKGVKDSIRLRTLSNFEKSAAIDQFFIGLQQVCEQHGPQLVEMLSNKMDEESSPIDKFISDVQSNVMIPRAGLTIRLLRDIIRLEEEHFFTLMTAGANRVHQINAASQLSKDTYFLFKQGYALTRLVTIAVKASRQTGRSFSDALDKDKIRLGKLSEIKEAGLFDSFDELYPELVKSADDLGLYYAKLLQSFSGLIFHFSKDAYKKIDYFQGQMPQKMTYEQVKSIIDTDLGMAIEQAFLTFEREPFANGSIAQVHWATLAGPKGVPTKVAVKVQKDYVSDELQWNMKTNAVLFDYLESLAEGKSQWIVRFFTSQARQLGQTFQGELDFIAEANRQDRMGWMLSPVKDLKIPKIFRKQSGARVITAAAVCDAQRIHMVFESPEACKHPPAAQTSASAPVQLSDAVTVSQSDVDVSTDARADTSAAIDADSVPEIDEIMSEKSDDTKVSVPKLFMEFSDKYGYSIGPQYFQLVRTMIPFVSVVMHLHKIRSKLEAEGRPKDDPEILGVKKTIDVMMNGFIYQALFVKELHSDYNWGNILVDPNHTTHLLDWGQTVSTKGMVLRPAVLILAFFKGDAKLIVKKLSQVGTFANLERDREELTAQVQSLLDAEGMEKQSWRQLFKSMFAGRTKSSDKAKVSVEDIAIEEIEKEEMSDGEKLTEEVKRPNTAEEKPAPTPEQLAKKQKAAESKAKFGEVVAPFLFKTIARYPYYRAQVKAYEVIHATKRVCERLLSR